MDEPGWDRTVNRTVKVLNLVLIGATTFFVLDIITDGALSRPVNWTVAKVVSSLSGPRLAEEAAEALRGES